MAEFITDEQIIHYEIIGDINCDGRTPILMLHGNGEDMHIFDAVVSKCADSAPIILMDSRLHGESVATPNGSHTLDYEKMADDALNLMLYLKISEYNVVGYSDGAIVSILMARKSYAPSKIIAIGVNLSLDGLSKFAVRTIRSELRKAKRKHDDFKAECCRLMLEQPEIPLSSLSGIVAEVTILLGSKDKFIVKKHSEAVANVLAHCSHIIVEGASHDIPNTNPRFVADCIRTLL